MEYIGTKVVWFDLRDSLLIQLYTPVPCLYPLSNLLQQNSPLDDALIQLSDLLGLEYFKGVFAVYDSSPRSPLFRTWFIGVDLVFLLESLSSNSKI